MSKQYLGDSVYADIEDGMIKLTKENGYGVSNVIYLHPESLGTLVRYVTNQVGIIPARRGAPARDA